jgi:mono/diheme cytochrome c family protein
MNRYSRLLVAMLFTAIAGCGSGAKSSSPSSAIANGLSIFQTGKDADGLQITAQPSAFMQSCAACHRANGSGGIRLPGGAVSADLRYKTLVTSQKHPYTLALLERAISTGIDDNGQPLNPIMPRWTLSQRDLHDVANYVLTRLK